ncbi:hypothetical protein [Candidatus Contubernalis alkaliaceticus]|uniref:hypothetical protein n=1 Tax=Candidatus Contubernalis alkaliaceticus TaxID=338645 RepID=UPI001F4C0C67|nr:hypothetical protein [Candidatus Contubernalis alkalaceticus]UNC91946.1 hypothetical protein HUE98_07450 [Candidatus Contubernalis alkalaceticus]
MSNDKTDVITLYNDLANIIWQRIIDIAGIHSAIVLVQRTTWITQQKYSEAEAIQFDKKGISFLGLKEKAEEEKLKLIIEEFFASLINILTRLIGEDISNKIAQEINEIIKAEGGQAWTK